MSESWLRERWSGAGKRLAGSDPRKTKLAAAVTAHPERQLENIWERKRCGERPLLGDGPVPTYRRWHAQFV